MPTVVASDPTVVANRLRPALLRLNRELRRETHALGVSGGQAALLHQIATDPGIGVNELAAREHMSPAGMSKSVARLESAGLVRRAGLDDRRRVGLTVTEEGARVLASVKRRRTAWLAGRLRGLSGRELHAVERAIEPLVKLLEVKA
jgi:DNA-binding MarR family transcriptional regulator